MNVRPMLSPRRWLPLLCLLLALCAAPALGEVLTVDYDYLRTVAPDSIGWLYQPDGPINHPVMYSQSATYYLRRRFDGMYSNAGAVFVTGSVRPSMDASVVTLRGVNRMSNTLMGSLSLYRDEAYYAKHPMLYLLTPEQNYRLDIFAGIRIRHTDHSSWQAPMRASRRYAMLEELLEQSFLTPRPEALPNEDDAWAVLTTEDVHDNGSRYVLYARKRPVEDAGGPVVYVNQMEMDARESVSGYATVEGVGTWMLYAQNDPLWKRLVFEVPSSTRQRPFGDGGCGPTSVAMAIANLVDKEDLSKINRYASDPMGYRFCTCCIGSSWCYQEHLAYQLTRPDEFLRYFPLAVADFAMGNNVFGVRGRKDSFGTNMSYLESICKVYDIPYDTTRDINVALDFLREEGRMVVACTTGHDTPFTKTSHFLVLARVTDEHLYVLDPLRRESYEAVDPNGLLEVVVPGLVRVKLQDVTTCHFYPLYLLKRPE